MSEKKMTPQEAMKLFAVLIEKRKLAFSLAETCSKMIYVTITDRLKEKLEERVGREVTPKEKAELKDLNDFFYKTTLDPSWTMDATFEHLSNIGKGIRPKSRHWDGWSGVPSKEIRITCNEIIDEIKASIEFGVLSMEKCEDKAPMLKKRL